MKLVSNLHTNISWSSNKEHFDLVWNCVNLKI